MVVTNDKTYLSQVSEPVSSPEEALSILEKLLAEIKLYPDSAGLSAIQIGIPKRAFIARRDSGLDFEYWVNPTIEEYEPETLEYVEGCLSFPGRSVLTRRSRQIHVTTQSLENWETKKYVLFGVESIVFQHEFDHLNGILMFERGIEFNAPISAEPKIGRNDKCPCGSSKKYKKCCGGHQ